MQEGFEGLLRNKTRPSRIPPLGANVATAWWHSHRAIRPERPYRHHGGEGGRHQRQLGMSDVFCKRAP